MARVLPYSWSLCALRNSEGASLSLEDCEAADPLNPETVSFLSRIEDERLPIVSGRRDSATPLSKHVMLNPQTEAGRRLAVLSAPSFSHEPSTHWHIKIGNDECDIPVAGAMRRANGWEEPKEHNSDEVFLHDTIDLLSGYFREAVALTHDPDYPDLAAYANQPVVRLDWKTIWERWKTVSVGNEPPMAQVVEIAFDYITRIRDVCERPRRMLVRQRELLPLGRVQELDVACLRDLIQRPGRTIPEKAGPRQELLAVTRRETVDTAENRVIRDFLRLCQHRAGAYVRENGRGNTDRANTHQKIMAVTDLRLACKRLDESSVIATAGRLVGVGRPNYVLQKDRRYHPLWVQYDKLRREEKAVDDVWPWNRVLWAEFVRGVVVGFLLSDEGLTLCGLRPDDRTLAYVRAEHQAGRFMPALSVSSCLGSRDGQARVLLIHQGDAHLCPGLEDILPRFGAELALAFYPPSGALIRPRALLCIYSVLSLKTSLTQRDAMLSSLQSTLDHVSDQNPGMNIHGLLLRGEWPGGRPPISSTHGRFDYLSAPAGGPFWFQEFPELLAVLLREVAG